MCSVDVAGEAAGKEPPAPRGIGPTVIRVAGVAVVYYLASRVGLFFAIPPADVTPVWPASGIGLAAVLRLGGAVWPGIWLGAATVALQSGNPVWVSAGIGFGNAFEALLSAWLVRRLVGEGRPFERGWDAVMYWAVAGWLGCAVGAAAGMAPLFLAGLIPSGHALDQWWAWWLGDVGGVVLVAPIVLAWDRPATMRWSPGRILEAAGLAVGAFVLGQVVFGGWVRDVLAHPLPYLILPLIVWTAFRFSQRDTFLLMALVAGVAIWRTAHGMGGPFRGESVGDSLMLMQSFINVISLTGLATAALVAEHRATAEALRQSRDELEQRVRDRTAELRQANAALQGEVEERSRMVREQERLVHELQAAMGNVKILTGLLPICVSCKRIRNDQGYWDQVETYISKHSEARFSHGTCPECTRRLYPEFFTDDAGRAKT